MAAPINFDLFEWVYIVLTIIALITFICFTQAAFKMYNKISNHIGFLVFALVIISYTSEIIMKGFGLLGVEV